MKPYRQSRFFTYFLPLVLTLLIVTSCGKRVLTDQTVNFDNARWGYFEPALFQADVDDTDNPYSVCLTLHYDTNKLQYTTIPVIVRFYIDSSEMHSFNATLRLKDRSGKRRGDIIDNRCIVTDTIDRCRIYNQEGQYTYRIIQFTSKYEIFGVESLRMRIAAL